MSISAILRNGHKVMNRADLTRRLVTRLKREEAVVAGIGFTNFDLWDVGGRPQNFYMLGSMGLALPIAFGVALAQPKRKIFGLEGDGSILMQLGTLGTIAGCRPANLAMIVWDNGAYQITGGQPTATAGAVDLVATARGLGIEKSFWAEDEAGFEALIDRALREAGPFFITAKIDNQRPARITHRDPAQIRERFMRAIGSRVDPFADRNG